MRRLFLVLSITVLFGCSSSDNTPNPDPPTNFDSGVIYGNKVTWKSEITGNYDYARFACSNTPDSLTFYYAGNVQNPDTNPPLPSNYTYSYNTVSGKLMVLNASVFTSLQNQLPGTSVKVSLYVDDKLIYSQTNVDNVVWRLKDLQNTQQGGKKHLYPIWVKKP